MLGGIKTTQFVEIDPDSQSVLKDNFPGIPIHSDVRTYHPPSAKFELVTAGFPCTGTSNAGSRTGLDHPESKLWRQAARVYIESGARYLVIEQPEGILNRGIRAILGFFKMAGMRAEIGCYTAAQFGAAHKRLRIFILAYPDDGGGETKSAGRCNQARAEVTPAWDYPPGIQPQWLRFRNAPGIPAQLVQGNRITDLSPDEYLSPRGTRKLACRRLAGKTVTPYQAMMPLQRILDLEKTNV